MITFKEKLKKTSKDMVLFDDTLFAVVFEDKVGQIIFVNSCNDNGSKIARLMKEFSNKERISSEFIHISERVRCLKEELGGEVVMCEKMEELAKEYAEYVVATAVAENDTEYIRKMLKKGYPIAEIAEISPLYLKEIEKIKAELKEENKTKMNRYSKKSLEKLFARYFRRG